MDIISNASFQVTDWELSHKIFSEALGFKTLVHNKTFSKYELDSHGQIITATANELYDSKPASIGLIVSAEKVERVAKLLKEANEKFVYSEKVGSGIISTLEWVISNGSILRLESFEDSYWDEK